MNKKLIVILVFLAAVAALAGCRTEEAQSPLSASLSELTGFVELKQAGQDTFAQAAGDSVLGVNGQVQTGDDGRVRLDLSSGTIIRVAPSSFFTLTSNDEVEGGLLTKIKLDIGKIFIILNGGQADVETPSGVASVKGSYMKVEVDPETFDIYITCLEGDCSASNPAGAVNFTNGQKVVLFHRDPVTGDWQVPNVEPMTPEEFQEWLDNNPEAKELFEQGMATLTAIAATEAPTEVSTEAPTEQPAAIESVVPTGDSSNACSQPQEPIDGSALAKIGQVNFAWTEQPGAGYYVITFINADGSSAKIPSTTNSAAFYIEVLPAGGKYEWFVTAFGSDGAEICSSPSVNFSKPKADPTQKPVPADRPEKTEVPCDVCNAQSSCYDQEYCEECIVEGVDYCQSTCSEADYCNVESSCYDPYYSYCE